MNKITSILIALLLSLSSIFLTAQQKSDFLKNLPVPENGYIRCAADEYNAQLLEQYPNMMGSAAYEKQIQQKLQTLSQSNQRRIVLRLPIVVHVVHQGEAVGVGRNISDAQVLSQIQVLNEDYRRLAGTNGFNTDPNGADIELEFFLAQEDPDCNPTNGINRILRSSLPNNGVNINTDIKPATVWDSSRYINIWALQIGGGTLGFAQFPGGNPMTDGVVTDYRYFGSDDAPGVNLGGVYNLGRTTTHELGHYFGLFHTFQGGCVGSGDSIDDTPAEALPNYGCPATPPDTCTSPGLDPIENYMDYSDDICMNIFTNDQKSRIQSTLLGLRASLLASDVPEAPLPDVNYDASIEIAGFDSACGAMIPIIQLTNYGTTTLTTATLSYDLNGGSSSTVNYTGSLEQGESDLISFPELNSPLGTNTITVSVSQPNPDERTCNDSDSEEFEIAEAMGVEANDLYFSITTDTYSNETIWEFTDSTGAILATGGPYNGSSEDSTTFTTTFSLTDSECYNFTILDSAGDGICCGFGNGSYELRENDIDGDIIIEGGEFDSVESFNFTANTLGVADYFSTNGVYVYPNPANNNLNIKLNNTNDLPDDFEIINMLGQSIMKTEILNDTDLNINTSGLSNGVYFIKLNKQQSSKVLQFVKK